MILSDSGIAREIRAGRLIVEPFVPEHVQPASLDVRLGRSWLLDGHAFKEDTYTLMPQHFVLAVTLEWVGLPNDLAAQLSLRSSAARAGLDHILAGWVDPGWQGCLTLELKNVGYKPLELQAGQRIAQLVFLRLETPCEIAYGDLRDSKYHGRREPIEARQDGKPAPPGARQARGKDER